MDQSRGPERVDFRWKEGGHPGMGDGMGEKQASRKKHPDDVER